MSPFLLTFNLIGMSNFNEELQQVTGGRSNVRTPQFPGQQKGYTIQQVRSLIKKQKRAKGYAQAIGSGNSEFNLDLSGTARIFLGFAIILEGDLTTQPEQFQLQINNEVIIAQTHPAFFSPDFMDDEYYYFPRPLSGTDEITVQYINPNAAQTVRLLVYYI